MRSIKRNWPALLGGSIAAAVLAALVFLLMPTPQAPTQSRLEAVATEHQPSVSPSERREEPRKEEPNKEQPSASESLANVPLMSTLKDLSTIPDKDSKAAKAAEPCSVISDTEIRTVFKNREVTFYQTDPAKRIVISNNPQLIRYCEYTGIMTDIYGNRANMTFTVFTGLDNAKNEEWKLLTQDLSPTDYVDDNVFTDGIGNYTARKGKVIIWIMPTSTQPGITDGDAQTLARFAQARLP